MDYSQIVVIFLLVARIQIKVDAVYDAPQTSVNSYADGNTTNVADGKNELTTSKADYNKPTTGDSKGIAIEDREKVEYTTSSLTIVEDNITADTSPTTASKATHATSSADATTSRDNTITTRSPIITSKHSTTSAKSSSATTEDGVTTTRTSTSTQDDSITTAASLHTSHDSITTPPIPATSQASTTTPQSPSTTTKGKTTTTRVSTATSEHMVTTAASPNTSDDIITTPPAPVTTSETSTATATSSATSATSLSTTSETSSTTTTVPMTTPVPPPGEIDPEYGLYDIKLTLKYYGNDGTQELLETELMGIYDQKENIGYSSLKITALDPVDSAQTTRRPTQETYNASYYFKHATEGDYIASYDVIYDMEIVLEEENSTEKIFDFIEDEAMPALISTNISGIAIDEEYIEDVVINQTLPQQKDELANRTKYVCAEPICKSNYYCEPNNTKAVCKPICYAENSQTTCCVPESGGSDHCTNEYEMCYITIPAHNKGDYICRCDETYMYLGSECYYIVYFIAALCAITGVLVVILLCIIIILAVRNHKRQHNGDGSRDSKVLAEDLSYPADSNSLYNVALDLEEGQSLAYGENVEQLKSFSASEVAMTSHQESSFGYHGNEEENALQLSAVEPTNQCVDNIAESDAYKNFHAQLNVVDTSANYFANRPAIRIRTP